MRPVSRALVALALALLAGPIPAAEAAERQKLRVVLALDVNSDLGAQLKVDRRRMEMLLRGKISDKRLKLEVVPGARMTREGILAVVKGLRLGPDEGLLFFYGGHGAIDRSRGHKLDLHRGSPLYRSELLAE